MLVMGLLVMVAVGHRNHESRLQAVANHRCFLQPPPQLMGGWKPDRSVSSSLILLLLLLILLLLLLLLLYCYDTLRARREFPSRCSCTRARDRGYDGCCCCWRPR